MNELAEAALDDLDTMLDEHTLTTDQMGDFWHAMSEGAVLRLIRLKPEMVRPATPDESEVNRLRAALTRLVECDDRTTLAEWREAQAAGQAALDA